MLRLLVFWEKMDAALLKAALAADCTMSSTMSAEKALDISRARALPHRVILIPV